MKLIGIDHVGLSVRNVKDSALFFTQILGFEKIGEKSDYPAIFLRSGNIRLTLWQADSGAREFDRKRNIGLHHLAIGLESAEDLEKIYLKLKDLKNVKIEFAPETIGTGPSQHMMIYEPGGIRIEFTVRVKT